MASADAARMLTRSFLAMCLLAAVASGCAGRPPLPTKMTDTSGAGADPLAGGGGSSSSDDESPGPPAEEERLDDDEETGPSAPFTPEPAPPAAPGAAGAGDCLESMEPSHADHGHAVHRHYTRAEVCEDEACTRGAAVLACIETTQDGYRSCKRTAEERRDAGARSTSAADRAEAVRCGGRRPTYVPMRFWLAYHRDHERCLDAYDASLRSCIGTWPIRERPPRLEHVPTAPVRPR